MTSSRALLSLVAALCAASLARAGNEANVDPLVGERPPELVGAEIVDKLGAKIPGDIALVDEAGKATTLGAYLNRGKPVLLTLGYYQCPMLCSLVLNEVVASLRKVSLDAGKDFDVVSVSIDPRDTPAVAAGKRAAYLKEYGRDGADWRFHVATSGGGASDADVKRLADAVGFGYRWDEATKNYAHGAGIFFLSPDGTLSRTLWGLTFEPGDVKRALIEASEGKVGTVIDRVLLTCFQYSTSTHKYNVYVVGVMRLASLITVLVVGTLLLSLWRRERLRGTV